MADWRAHAESLIGSCSTEGYKRSPRCSGLLWQTWYTYGGSSRTREKLPDRHREEKQTDGGEGTPRRRRGKVRVKQSALLTLAAVMLVGAFAERARRSEADTQCFQKSSFQEDQEKNRGEESLLDGERRAQVRSEFQRQDASSTMWWFRKPPTERNTAMQIWRGKETWTPPDKIKPCPMCDAPSQLQARKGKCAISETPSTTVWKCLTCSDGFRKRGIPLCMGYGAPVKGDEGTEIKKSAGASAPKQEAETAEPDIAENDLKKCNICSEPFVFRRARRQDHGRNCSRNECGCAFVSTQTNHSWIYTCRACQRQLCLDCHAKEIGRAPVTRAYASAATPPSAAPLVIETEPEKNMSHERLLFLLSKIDASRRYRRSNGYQEDWTKGMRQYGCKPWTERCKQRKPTQQLRPRSFGARWHFSFRT